jgi:hypothetical protein
MDINKIFQSKLFKGIVLGIGAFIVLLLIFNLGMFVGFRKANFSFRWGENYHQNFAGPRGGFFRDFEGKDFIESHGTFGEIIKINESDFVIKGQADVEKIIVITKDTVLEEGRQTITENELKVGDRVVVIGTPNDAGQIEAKLIRIMPPPPMNSL